MFVQGGVSMSENKGVPGPDPERVKLPHKKWEDAVREALDKKRPKDGWPEDREPDKEAEPEGDEE
jgi:hypothetical protein